MVCFNLGMKKIVGSLSAILIIILLCSGFFTYLVEFFTWLFILDYSAPPISIAGEIIVRVLSFVVTYELVGIVFGVLGFYNSKFMKIMYFVFSTLISFVLTYIVWTIETYLLVICIVLGIVFVLVTGLIITFYFLNKEKENGVEDED